MKPAHSAFADRAVVPTAGTVAGMACADMVAVARNR